MKKILFIILIWMGFESCKTPSQVGYEDMRYRPYNPHMYIDYANPPYWLYRPYGWGNRYGWHMHPYGWHR